TGAWSFLKNLEQPPGSLDNDADTVAALDRMLDWKYPFSPVADLPQTVRIAGIGHLLGLTAEADQTTSHSAACTTVSDENGQYTLWPAEELETGSLKPTTAPEGRKTGVRSQESGARSSSNACMGIPKPTTNNQQPTTALEERTPEWDDEQLEERRVSFTAPVKLSPTESRRPGGAAAGTANHLVLQHLNLDGPLDEAGIKLQIRTMTDDGLLQQEDAASVLTGEIAAFFQSDLGRRMLSAKNNLHRELPFSLLLPAAEVYPDIPPELLQGESVSLYGIIDCLIKTPEGYILIDYKTDRLGPDADETARAGYSTQMKAYSLAVERITGKPVLESWIYLLRPGVAVQV
ncbi:MAG: PD-(D/E)XK nuclease family protein, partial [bacterium]|nr:PD-(D/E)XK nuclease family protein [bacterium]